MFERPDTRGVVLSRVQFPKIGHPEEPRPELSDRLFSARLAKVRRQMKTRGLDAMVIYGDREHFANQAYLTNFTPRFEEALLVIFPVGKPILFLGNEGMDFSKVVQLDIERRLCQALSLLGQPRNQSQPLHRMLKETGLKSCRKIGVVGWKYFTEAEVEGGPGVLDLPEFLGVSLRKAVAPRAIITNETAMFMDAETGLRNTHEPEQLAYFEWVATHNSANLLQGIRAVKPGMTEFAVFERMSCNGTPFACSPAVTAGDNFRRGSRSPTSNKIKLGDPIFMTYAYQGANVCRFGWVAHGPQDLPKAVKDYTERALMPYFAAMVAWYEALRIGATGDQLHHAVADRLEPLGFHLGLNIGHQIAMDEWVHSFVGAGSTGRVRSGMYWQADFFGSLRTPHLGAFAEDGVAVADARLRKTLASRYPKMWARVQVRRRFMIETLGCRLAEEMLPFSNFPAVVIPYFLSPNLCPVMGGHVGNR